MAVLSKGNLFDPVLVTDLINKVKGHSSLAVLSAREPIPFNGMVLCQETVQVKLKDFLKLPSVLNYPILLDIVLHSRSVTGSHNNYVS
jgi:hypothetical protein